MLVFLLQERWADPEEDYYKPEKRLSMKHSGKDDDLEIDAGDVSGGKLKRMHPFGQGIRCVLCFTGYFSLLASVDTASRADRPGQIPVSVPCSKYCCRNCRSANRCRHWAV